MAQGRWFLRVHPTPSPQGRRIQSALKLEFPTNIRLLNITGSLSQTLDNAAATRLAGEAPEYGIDTLFNDIEAGNFPSWTVYVVRITRPRHLNQFLFLLLLQQTMTPAQAEKFRYNVLDLTKIWPHSEFPLRPVGKFVLNENPQNYFAEIEQVIIFLFSPKVFIDSHDETSQAAFSPSHLIPYIEPSADPVLQSRLFSYPDTHRHRLGVNYQQLPVNAPITPVNNFQRDGAATYISQGSRPNYQSSIHPLTYAGQKGSIDATVRDQERLARHEAFVGGAWRDLTEVTERKRPLILLFG